MAITQSERSKFYEPKNKLRIVIGVAIALVIIWVATPLIMHFLITGKDAPAERGQFGDMFGVITSLFSCLTIVGLIYTIIQQQEDLQIARESLSEQKEELKLTRGEFTLQNKTLKHQKFENTFFKLLELQTFITNELRVFYFKDSGEKKEPTFKGEVVELSGSVHKEFTGKATIEEELDLLLYHLGRLDSKDIPIDYVGNYRSYAESNLAPFDRYLTNIKTIYDFICNSKEIEFPEKPFYVRLFAMQLNPYELIYYFYYMTLYADVTSETQAQELDLVQYINPDLLGNYSHINLYQKNV